MRISILSISCFIFWMFLSSPTMGQMPEVGKPMPDFTLSKVSNFPKQTVSNNDFKGKWLFLDFWFPGCSTCIESFPKISRFADTFKEKASFVMVGWNLDEYKGIEQLYEKFRKKQQLQMAYAFDSVLFASWQIHSMPHIIIVRPDGNVYAITGGRDMTLDKVKSLINGDNVSFYPKDIERPLFAPGEATRSNIMYQSLLTKWQGESQAYRSLKNELKYLKDSTGLNFSMLPLEFLYRSAYLGHIFWDSPSDSLHGHVYPEAVLEMRDKSEFDFDFTTNVGKGTYNYSLIVPPARATVGYVMRIMQNDLKNTFGYDVSIETREMPVWKLIARPGAAAKLRTKGGEPYFSSRNGLGVAAGFTANNFSIDQLLQSIMFYIGVGQPPYFDETGITGNIDLKMDAIMTDWKAVREQLNANGLDLIKGSRLMKVLVIRDPGTTDAN